MHHLVGGRHQGAVQFLALVEVGLPHLRCLGRDPFGQKQVVHEQQIRLDAVVGAGKAVCI